MNTSSKFFGYASAFGLALALALAPSQAEAKKGFYFGLGLGYGSVSGDTGIGIENAFRDVDSMVANADLDELFRSDAGSGFAMNFRLGYNILGVVALEAEFGGSGNNITDGKKIEGQAGIFMLVKVFPAQFFKGLEDRFWDPYIYAGGGIYFMGYNPDAHPPFAMANDGRVWWPSTAVKYGLGCDFYVSPFLSLGVDLAFINGFHSEYHYDEDQDPLKAKDTASSFVFQPTVKATFHFLTQ